MSGGQLHCSSFNYQGLRLDLLSELLHGLGLRISRLLQYSEGRRRVGAETATLVISRLGDDPDPLTLAGLVGRQDAAAVDHGSIIEAAIFLVEVAPVAGDVASEELIRRLTGILEGVEGTGRGDDPTEAELLGGLIYDS